MSMAETIRPEAYPPQDNRVPENVRQPNRAPEQSESTIAREFVTRPVTAWPKRMPAPNPPVAENQEEVIRRIAGISLAGIDQTIRELEVVRGMLISEGERISREISGYAGLSQSAASAMKNVAAMISEWKTRSDASDKQLAR
jgi:hypothetical protein